MKKYEIYFVGNSLSFVSSVFLESLINLTKKNNQFDLKYVIDTDPSPSYLNTGIAFKIKKKIISIIYFFFNKYYYNLLNSVNYVLSEKKNIITQAKDNNIEYKKIFRFNKNLKKKNSILVNCGGIKIFKNFFLNKFDICINYHHAEIPKFRGTYSNCLSLFYNNSYTYFCFHYINSKIDKGYVFYKHKVKINKKIKNNLFYEIIKIKIAAKNVKKIFNMALKMKKYKSLSLKKGNYYTLYYYKNLFENINQFTFKQINKYIDIFGGIFYKGDFVTGIKKSEHGIPLKDYKIKIIEIKYLPIFLYRFLSSLFLIKP